MSNRFLVPAALLVAGMLLPGMPSLAHLLADEVRPSPVKDSRAVPAWEREIERKLRSPVTLSCQDTPLRKVLEELRSVHGINIVPDKATLHEEGVNLDHPVTLKLEGIPLKSALKLLLDQAGLTYALEDEVLKITTPNHARGPRIQRVYPVADLVIPLGDGRSIYDPNPKQVTRKPALAGEPAVWTVSTTPQERPKQTLEEQLIHLIKNTVSPQSWSDRGGSATVEYFPLTMALLINQTRDMHEQIDAILAALRRLQDVEVVVETRILSVSEGFLQRIGMDFLTQAVDAPAVGAKQPASSPLRSIEGITITEECRRSRVTYLEDVQVMLLMEAAQADSRTHLMQAPKVTMFNGQRATIKATDQQQFTTGVLVRWDGDKVVQVPHHETISIGLEMSLQPVIAADRKSVRLNLKGGLTALDPATIPPASAGARAKEGPQPQPASIAPPPPRTDEIRDLPQCMQQIQKPRVSKVSVEKTLTIPDGKTALVYVGERACARPSECAAPVVNKLPNPIRLFRNVGYGRETEHVLVMVTPKVIINEAEEMRPAPVRSPAPLPRTVAATAAVRPAVAQEQKPAAEPSRTVAPVKEKKVARLLEKYHRACAEGRLDDAREFANRALALDPACFRRER